MRALVFGAVLLTAVMPVSTAGASPEVPATKAQRAEVMGARSETRQVFAEPDGSYTMELTAQPARAKKGHDWVPIDTTLKKLQDGTIAPEAAAVSLAFAGGGTGKPLVRLAIDGKQIALSWPDPLPEPALKGDTATYANVLPDVDLQLRATAQSFSKVLVVKTREAAKDPRLAKLRFGLSADGLAVSLNPDGGLLAKDNTGRAVLASSKAQMWDSANRHSIGGIELPGNGELVVVPDQKFLNDAAYPVMIDPDFYPPGAGWTKVFEGVPNRNYWNGAGDDGLAKVGYCGWAGCNGIATTRSFFQFDISALRGAQILGAEFNMHEVWSPSCSARAFDVYQVGPIDGNTTWNNQPGGWWGPLGSPNVAYGYNANCPANWVGVAAGQSIINRLNDGSNVATFALKAYGNDWQIRDAYAWKKFDSGSLIVHYNWPPNAPSSLWANVGQGPSLGCQVARDVVFTPSARPTLRATLSDPDGHNLEANFEWWVWGGSAPVGSTRTAFQANGTAHAVTVPAGAFADGTPISWRVRAGDGYIWGPWSAWCQITVDTSPPGRPGLTSTDYPQDQVGGYVGKTGAFTATSADTDVIGFQWSLNFQDFPIVDVNSPYFVRASNGTAVIRATPPREGRNDLYVRAVDRALNVSAPYQKPDGNGGWVPGGYGFLVGSTVPQPIGHWPLDGSHTTTTAADVSGRDHHGTITGIGAAGGAAWDAGRVGDSLRFNSGYVSTAGGRTVDTSGTFSVSAWVRLDNPDGANHVAVSQDGNRVFSFYLGYVGDQQRFTFRTVPSDSDSVTTSARANSFGAPYPAVWTHLTGVFEAGSKQLRLYVNGDVQGTATLDTPWTFNGALQIGRAKYMGNYTDYWPGAIDDVKVWDRMLADAEIRALANKPTIEQAFFPLDEGTGTRTSDVSGNYRTGTLTGGPTWMPGVVGGGAVAFDGVDDAITTTSQAVRTEGSYTVTARARLDAANGNFQTVVSQDGPNSSGFALQYLPTTRKWSMAVNPGDSPNPQWISAQSAAPAAAGEWVNLAGVYDAGKREVRLYVNGVEHITSAHVPAHVPGNLVIGRAKQSGAGGLVAFFGGRIDDVHVYTGVRTKDEIVADSLNPVTARPTVYSGQLSRYVGHNWKHYITNGPVPPGQRFEWPLGLLAPPGTPDTRMLYSCHYVSGQFVSLQADCEGQTFLGEIGLLYRNPPAGVPSHAIYRCVVAANGDHFNSHDSACEGHKTEGKQGYTAAYRYLIRYVREYLPQDQAASTVANGLAAGYRPEGVLGILADSAEPNPRGLMSCYDGADEFLSNDANCEGKTVRWWVGNAWQEPPQYAQETASIYACRVGSAGDRFTSLDEFCEGHTVIGWLGYVITRM